MDRFILCQLLPLRQIIAKYITCSYSSVNTEWLICYSPRLLSTYGVRNKNYALSFVCCLDNNKMIKLLIANGADHCFSCDGKNHWRMMSRMTGQEWFDPWRYHCFIKGEI